MIEVRISSFYLQSINRTAKWIEVKLKKKKKKKKSKDGDHSRG